MKILLLFDLSITLKPEQYADYMGTDDWASERHILATLEKLGHEAIPLGIHDDLDFLLSEIKRIEPDLVFNLSEAFRGNRKLEPHMASLIELLDIPFTGASPHALSICKDKGLAKKILTYHRVKVPHFIISRKSTPARSVGDLKPPFFIKPLNLEASEGISQLSFAETKKDALERVRYLHGRFETDVIVEEYIVGRELYVGVIGNERLTTFPARELFFREVAEGEPKFASFKAKWDDDYRKKWGISTGDAALTPEIEARLEEACKKIYRVLALSGYGRIDLRLTETGELFCIEANPNPSIEMDGDFALSAIKSGMTYDELIQKIINLAFAPDPGDPLRMGTRRKKK